MPSVVTGAVADAEAVVLVLVEVALDELDELDEALVQPYWQPAPQWPVCKALAAVDKRAASHSTTDVRAPNHQNRTERAW